MKPPPVIFLMLACTLMPLTSPADKSFTPAPYIELLNAKAAADYAQVGPVDTASTESGNYRLTAGHHRLVIKGREPESRLEQIWLGSPTDMPERNSGLTILAANGKIIPPMRLEKQLLIGGNNQGRAIYEFTLPAATDYALWGKAAGPNWEANSFTVTLDDGPEMIWDIPVDPNTKTVWARIKGRDLSYYSSWRFSLAWAATSPHSRLNNDLKLRRLALTLTEFELDKISSRQVQPPHLWFLQDLETVYMWQQDPRTPATDLERLMRKIRPCVDNCWKTAETHEPWQENTPNIQLQTAALLQLAAVMWEKVDPAAASRWSKTARECLERAWKWKQPQGFFAYSYGSGVDAGYFAEDAKHLCRYYLLTGDTRVRKALCDMAAIASTATTSGHPLSFGSPWWKHCYRDYNSDRRNLLPSLILSLTRNAAYARMIELDQQRRFAIDQPAGGNWLIPYYNLFSPPVESAVAPLTDGTCFSSMENGPALRYGHLNVAMPWQSWCESTCGASYSSPEAITSMVCSIILTAVTDEQSGKVAAAHYPVAWSVVEPSPARPDFRATLCGPDFIVAATVFRPALGGPALPHCAFTPNHSPWQRTDIYWADRNGFAGALELKALRANHCQRVAVWAYTSDNPTITGNSLNLPGLTVSLNAPESTRFVNLGKTWGYSGGFYPLNLIECIIAKPGINGFAPGDRFQANVSLTVANGQNLQLIGGETKNQISCFTVTRNGRQTAQIILNRHNTSQSWTLEGKVRKIIQSTAPHGTSHDLPISHIIMLSPNSLTVLLQ